MKTKIRCIHEEEFVGADKTIGVLFNYSIEDHQKGWKDSYPYYYKDGVYIFFITIMDLVNYLLYGESDIKRSYLKEETFDKYYEMEYIDGSFKDILEWM